MFVSHPRTRPTRRGAILIVVLAMLALFAVLGISFVLYADAQRGAAQNNKNAENKDSPPDPMLAAQQYLLVQMYGAGHFGDDLMNPLRGHDFGSSKYGGNPAFPRFSPFSGQDIPPEPPGFTLPGVGPIDRRQVVRFTWDATNNFVVDPERWYNGTPVRSGAGAHSAPLVGTYVNRAVPSTYPDRNNFYLARMNPNTGQIDTPSYHREDLFGNLAPSNPNWTNAAGKYLTLRPRPVDHPNFPLVPPNADGTYTGDVSNLKFITNSQKNDSIWIDFGGPVLEWRGRKYKALVAPLILDLNSRVNLSVAGNVRPGDINPADVGPTPIPNSYVEQHPRHTGLHGLGPWEVNPTAVFPAPAGGTAWGGPNWELFALLRQRFPQPTPMPDAATAPPRILVGATPQPDPMYAAVVGRVGHSAQPRYIAAPPPVIPLLGLLNPAYSRLDTDGVTIARPIATTTDPMIPPLPGGFGPFPTYPGTRFAADQDTYVQSAQRLHPSMFNPFQWQRGGATTPTSGTKPFGNDDAMKWVTRFTDSKGRYTNTNLYRDTAATMAAGGWGTPANLATPFVHATTTLFSSSQQWAEIPVATGPPAAGVQPFVNLGPIDVNRPLADYRRTAVWFNPVAVPNRFEPVPHSPVNVWNPNVASVAALPLRNEPALFALARQARQNLARDVFVRLFALTGLVDGTTILYNPATGYFVFPTGVAALPVATQNMLRLTAQFAANVVDYTDADDVNTAFVWNPINPAYVAQFNDGTATPLADPATGLPILDPSADLLNYAPAEIGTRVVYGTELPRLVINEADCTLSNARMAPGTSPMKRRYWIELHNPLPADAAPSPLSDGGAARLQYEAGVTAFQNPANPAAAPIPAAATFNPYRLEVATAPDPGAGVSIPYSTFLAANQVNAVADTAAVPGMTLQVRINNFIQDTTAPAPAAPVLPAAGDGKNVVLPANGAATDAGTKNAGYYLIGPLDQFPAAGTVNSLSLPDPAAGVPTPAAPVNALTFDAIPGAPSGTDITTERAKRSVIILRKLANQYVPPQPDPTLPGYNPYVTIDYLENLPSRDRVTTLMGGGSHTPADGTAPTVGRKHPYASFPTYGSNTPHPTLPLPATSDAVVDQTAAGGVSPPHSFFSANSNLDNATGLPWLVHLDRQLINSLELLHVSTHSPAVLTNRFFSERLDAANNPFAPTRVFEYQRHTTWNANAGTAAEPLVPALRTPGWYKALDLLVGGNPMPGVPVGGREPGRINPNTIADPRLLNAVLDPQPGNAFATGAYAANPTLISNYAVGGPVPVWTALNAAVPDSDAARTPFGVPRATIAESGLPTGDRPFRSFAGSPDLQDSLLRTNRQPSLPAVPGTPILFNAAAGHPHAQAEPLRKMLNSLTPTSDSFLVVMTVSFFEVSYPNPLLAGSVTNQPIFGKELFNLVSGDLRAQFAAVMDRSQLAVEHDGTTGAISANVASTRLPVQMKLLRDTTVGTNQIVIEAGPPDPALTAAGVPSCTLYDNGIPLALTPGRLLRLGSADVNTALPSGASNIVSGDGEWVMIANVSATIPNPIQQLTGPDASGAATVPIPGHYRITLEPGFAMTGGWAAGVVNRYHAAGAKVTTTVMGNPGPQTGISLEQLRSRGLVPYFTPIAP